MEERNDRKEADAGVVQFEDKGEEEGGLVAVELPQALQDRDLVVVRAVGPVGQPPRKTAQEGRAGHKGRAGEGKAGDRGLRLHNEQAQK